MEILTIVTKYVCRKCASQCGIIQQALNNLPAGPVKVMDNKLAFPSRGQMKSSMEAVIHHFKLFSSGFNVPAGSTYVAI